MHYRELALSTFFILLMMIRGNVDAKEPAPWITKLNVVSLGYEVQPPIRMQGKGFKWEHEIQVALPTTYNTEHKSYPVLWLLDGSGNFSVAVRTLAAWNAVGELPEMIIVGVGAPADVPGSEWGARRTYEFSLNSKLFEGIGADLAKRFMGSELAAVAKYGTGGAPKFLGLLVDELRPTLEKKYRMSGSHTLYGGSGGGYFCTYALLTRPKSFDRYICASPDLYVGDNELFRLEEKYAEANKDLPAAVYFAAGEGEILQGGAISALGVVSSTARMAEMLGLRAYPSLRLYVHIFPYEKHGTGTALNLEYGLRALWGTCNQAVQSETCGEKDL